MSRPGGRDACPIRLGQRRAKSQYWQALADGVATKSPERMRAVRARMSTRAASSCASVRVVRIRAQASRRPLHLDGSPLGRVIEVQVDVDGFRLHPPRGRRRVATEDRLGPRMTGVCDRLRVRLGGTPVEAGWPMFPPVELSDRLAPFRASARPRLAIRVTRWHH